MTFFGEILPKFLWASCASYRLHTWHNRWDPGPLRACRIIWSWDSSL